MPEFAAPASETGRPLEAAARDGRRSGAEAAALRQAARQGLAGASSPYPHGERIRQAFGQFAPAGLRAHMGPATRAVAGRMNAAAFVLDGRAAFAGRPSLHTAAHEATHLAHYERGGAALRHGVGALGDRHETLADRVANVVVAGGSAEPLLAASLPADVGSAGPMLQMAVNAITGSSYTTPDSPWTEIQKQLPFTDANAATKLVKKVPVPELQGPFGRMVQTLKASCDRAGDVTASINGTRNGGARAGDLTQTAYGTLGKLEAYLNEAMPGPKENYEGGHLISDQILGVDSYVQFNFAPQQRPFNSPFYRAIEKIGHQGLKLKASPVSATPSATPDATYKAAVRYPTSDYSVKRTDLERLFDYGKYVGLPPSALAKVTDSPIDLPVYKAGPALPATVSLTPRVPSLWIVKVDTASPDHEFKHQATITKGKGMDTAFEPLGEATVQGLVSASNDYSGDIRWAMNSMTVAKPGGNAKKSWGTTTESSHTFTAVQAPPRNPAASSGGSSGGPSGPVVPTTVGGPPSLSGPSLAPTLPGPTPGTGLPPPSGPTSGGPTTGGPISGGMGPTTVSLTSPGSISGFTPSTPLGPPPSIAHSLLPSQSGPIVLPPLTFGSGTFGSGGFGSGPKPPGPTPGFGSSPGGVSFGGPPPTLSMPSPKSPAKPPPSHSLLSPYGGSGPSAPSPFNFGSSHFAPPPKPPGPTSGFGGFGGGPTFAVSTPSFAPMPVSFMPPYGGFGGWPPFSGWPVFNPSSLPPPPVFHPPPPVFQPPGPAPQPAVNKKRSRTGNPALQTNDPKKSKLKEDEDDEL